MRRLDLTGHLPLARREPLDESWVIQPACLYCLAAKNVNAARLWNPRGSRVCLRHKRWTGPYGEQFDISALPEVVRAQVSRLKLTHRYGWQQADEAMREADEICTVWWGHRKYSRPRSQRIKVLQQSGRSRPPQDVAKTACGYPEIVTLATLLANPALRRMPFTGRPADLRFFLDILQTRVAPGYRFDTNAYEDPLIRWYEQERRHHEPADPVPHRYCKHGKQKLENSEFAEYCSDYCRVRSWRVSNRHRAELVLQP